MCQVMDLYLGDTKTNKDIYIGIGSNVTHGPVAKKMDVLLY